MGERSADTARIAAQRRLDSAIAADPVLDGLMIGVILRAMPDRTVAQGDLAGERVIIKQFIGPDAPGIVRALVAELALLAPRMSTGRAQVNRCLLASPDNGIVVLGMLPGERMSHLLPQAGAHDRAQMLRDAGGFLLLHAEGRRSIGQFGPAHWMRRFDRFDAARLGAEDRNLLTALHAVLFAQSTRLRGAAVCKAAVHGDFVPLNLNADAGGVYAFDIQGTAIMPLSFDIARFLAWVAAEARQPPGPHWLGVAEADRDAFLVPGLPDPAEHPGILPFLLGHQIAGRLYERAGDPDRAGPVRRAARRYVRRAGSTATEGPGAPDITGRQ